MKSQNSFPQQRGSSTRSKRTKKKSSKLRKWKSNTPDIFRAKESSPTRCNASKPSASAAASITMPSRNSPPKRDKSSRPSIQKRWPRPDASPEFPRATSVCSSFSWTIIPKKETPRCVRGVLSKEANARIHIPQVFPEHPQKEALRPLLSDSQRRKLPCAAYSRST